MSKLNIKIGMKLDKISGLEKEVQKNLESLSKKLKLKIDNIDLGNLDKSLSKVEKQVNTLSKKAKIKPEVDNSELIKQEKYLDNMIVKLERMKNASNLKSTKNEGYDNTDDISKILRMQQQVNDLKNKGVTISREEKNALDLQVKSLDTKIKKESSFSVEVQKSGKFLDTQLSKLKKQSDELSKMNNSTSKTNLTSQYNDQIASLERMKQQNVILGNVERQRISSTVGALGSQTSALRTQTNELNRQGGAWGSLVSQMSAFAIGGSIIYAGLNQIRKGITSIIELDSAMRDLKRVSDETSTTYEMFTGKANKMAMELGHSTKAVIDATTEFKKLGYSFKESSEYLSESALILSNVGNIGIEESVSSIVSILKGFKLETQDVTAVMDQLNDTGNKFAISTGDIATALQKVSAPLAVANNGLAESIAMITTANEVMQDSSTVANGLKTISMRLRGVDEDSGKLIPKMKDLILSMTNGQVDIENTNGSFKNTYQILNELGGVYDTLTDKQRVIMPRI